MMAAAGASRPVQIITLLAALVVVSSMMGSSHAYDFYVGGKQGWVQNPSESYDAWAGRNRFQVNDRLVFRYKKGEDSVLVVTEPAYRACDTSNPIRRLVDGGGGDSVFQFDRSGRFYFISGVPERCRAGQKLLVVVLSPRGGRPSPASPPLPSAAPPSPPPAGPLVAPPPPALPPPSAAGPGGAAPSAPPSDQLPRGQPPSGSSPLSSPFETAVTALALAGATLLLI